MFGIYIYRYIYIYVHIFLPAGLGKKLLGWTIIRWHRWSTAEAAICYLLFGVCWVKPTFFMKRKLVGGFNTSKKYESQLGWRHSQLNGKIKHVLNHQPVIIHIYIYIYVILCVYIIIHILGIWDREICPSQLGCSVGIQQIYRSQSMLLGRKWGALKPWWKIPHYTCTLW